MEINHQRINFRELADGYRDDGEGGVFAYRGELEVRPAYQREFVYKDKKRDAVVLSVVRGLPINLMYWQVKEDGTFAVMDGQQRIISVCQYINGDYSINDRYFHNLTQNEKDLILDYECDIYLCDGTEGEILNWFRTINVSSEPLTDQELRNTAYTGPWLHEAKKFFSKTNCPAYRVGSDYVSGTPIRQDYLETALEWIADAQDLPSVEEYMAQHQHDADATELWMYFQNVITWVQTIFPNYRREMKGIRWGKLYNLYHDTNYNPATLEQRIVELMEDEEVTAKKGIYEYLLNGNEKHLSLRQFSPRDRRAAYERQNGYCAMCHIQFNIEAMQGDHITPWSKGGRTILENCQMLCADCNRRKLAI